MAIPVPVGPEPLSPTPRPKPDAAHGMIILAASNGDRTHRMRFHIPDFNPAVREDHTINGITIGPINIGGFEAKNDIPYTVGAVPPPADPSQVVEDHVGLTMHNLREYLRTFFTADWTLQCVRLYQNLADPGWTGTPTKEHPYPRIMVEVQPLPATAATPGTNGNPVGSRASETAFFLKTQLSAYFDADHNVIRPGRALVRVLESPYWKTDPMDENIIGDAASTDLGAQLVAYLGCDTSCPIATAVLAHDGNRMIPQAHVKYGFYQWYRRSKFNRAP